MPTPLILASTSPYRRALLERLRLPFRCLPPQIDEEFRDGEAPSDSACRLAQEKAVAVSNLHRDALVIGSDQVPSIDGEAFGKPGDAQRAKAQLRRSSGRSVRFDTAVTLAQGGRALDTRCVPFFVDFRALSDAEIAAYVELEEPLDCAGSFRWEGLGIALFTALRGTDPTALEGLPLITLSEMLAAQGINPLMAAEP